MEEDPGPHELISSLKRYFNQDKFSDVVIRCRDQEFQAHGLILASQSSVFAKMLEGPWKESVEGIIQIDDIEANVVEAMLHYMYTFYYDVPENASAMVFEAQIYSAADLYEIKALKYDASHRFRSAIQEGWSTDSFGLAIMEVYQSTPDEDRCLREQVVEISNRHIVQLMGNCYFNDALRILPAFSVDLLSGLSEEVSWQRRLDSESRTPSDSPSQSADAPRRGGRTTSGRGLRGLRGGRGGRGRGF